MQKELRKTGNDVIGSVPWATHFCQFYQTKQDLLDILVPYFKAGLESNEFCMWITAEPLIAEEARKAMARAVPGFSKYLKKGQIEILPHTEWYLKGGSFDSQRVLNGWVEKLNQALAKGYEGLRLTGNTFWLEKKDWKSFADYEDAVNSVIGKYNMLALCTYCLDRCSAIEIIDVMRNHEFALIKREGKWELIESSINKQTREALEASETRLAHLASFPELNPMPVIELDMAGNIRYMNPATKRLFPDMSAMGSEHPFLANWEALSNTLRSEEPQSLTREINIGGSCYEQSVTYVPLTQSLIFRGLDITERKQTEEALKESQRDLSHAQAVARIGSWRLDIRHNELLWSDETYRLFGIPTGVPMTYEKFLATVYPEDRQYVDQKWQAALRGGDYDIEHRIVVGNEVKWVREKAELESEQDILKSGFGTVQDITERKQAEEALRQTRDYLNNLLDYSNAPIIVWDPQFCITRFNRAFERLTGLRASEVRGRQLDILFPEDSRAESLDHIREAVAGERWEVVEIPIQHVDGSVRTVLWNSATLYGADDKTAVATIAQGQDITERKQAEEALRETRDYLNNLLGYANAPIIVWDPQFRITRFNHAFERLTGLKADEVLGRQLDILFPEDSRDRSLDHIRKAVAGERWEVVEIPIQHVDGSVRTVLWNSATLYGADGKTAVATIAQGQDISERKQAEEEVKRLNESLQQRATELEAANKELESFSYSVSHDLRAPLRSMDGFSQALLEDYSDKLDDEGRGYLKRIQDSAGNMAQLIDDMLELSRLTRVSMRRETVNLSELAESIAAELKKAQPKRHVEVSIAPGLVVYGDGKLLRVVLENLLDNAWKFTSKIAHARIEGGITEHDGREVYFVRDNGAGFDMAYADKLFVPFQRLHRTTEFPGTGIGLATVKRLIHRHGGEAWAEGEVGKGATFYFTLP